MSEEYYLDDNRNYIIKNYQNKNTFASFLPGIAGKMGIPLWAFYVNRGQGIASFGLKNKDSSIMEFYPANKSYQNVAAKGFRTFFKLQQNGEELIYEPFRKLDSGIKTEMEISLHALTITETNYNLDLMTKVKYFILPGENFAALVRRANVKNLSDTAKNLEILDGMPILIPYGIKHNSLKEISQTISAWAKVYCLEDKTPFYRLRATAEDDPEVKKMSAGNFYIAFTEHKNGLKLLSPLVDREVIFAEMTGLEEPLGFKRDNLSEYKGEQLLENQFPAAMTAKSLELTAGEKAEINSLFGHLADRSRLAELKNKVLTEGYLDGKESESENIHNYYADKMFTVSGSSKLDAYSRQTFMDNILRGGFPENFGSQGSKTAYHIFSRKHGDLERDYNDFQLEPAFYSQGNGNYRDINQNRRSDLFFNPEVKQDNIKVFVNLIQANGYNPLVIEGKKFILSENADKDKIAAQIDPADKDRVFERLNNPFTPGEFALFIENHSIDIKTELDILLDIIIDNSCFWTEANYGEGYWIDHWTYIMDLIENYLAVYPEKDGELLFHDRSYTFYDNYVRVLPRQDKYVLTEKGPRQYDAVLEDKAKKQEIAERDKFPHYLRTGDDEIYYTDLATKLMTLVINKISTIDPAGVGIEMEANKPGWYDALNGLPGLFGSSTAETMELLRLVEFLQKKFKIEDGQSAELTLPIELYEFYLQISEILEEWARERDDFSYWQQASSAREKYRSRVFACLSGEEEVLHFEKLQEFLGRAREKLEDAVESARGESGLYNLYYYYEAVEYEKTGEFSESGLPLLKITEFKQHNLPAFLEGQVRAYKVLKSREAAARLHDNVQSSELYDRPLQMYRVNEDLTDQSYEIGRARAFSSGWLENGSIWLHMEYKYLLELLKAGLYQEFYQAIENALIPFQNPERYGRSILENSSFLLSSYNTDRKNHGRGYVARLSGSTAEYIHIWSLMAFGPEPFKHSSSDKELIYAPRPALKAEFFTRESKKARLQFSRQKDQLVRIPENSFAHRFLGSMLVIYNNPGRKDTFGDDKALIRSYKITTEKDREIKIKGGEVKGELAHKIRDGRVKKIDILLK